MRIIIDRPISLADMHRSADPVRLRRFRQEDAGHITRWVDSAKDLWWLAPSTTLPLTPKKVCGWVKKGGAAFVLEDAADAQPLAYGELNPMARTVDQLWLGHLVVRPDVRGTGLGRKLVHALLARAFGLGGMRSVFLVVFPDNLPAIRCYESVGFRRSGTESHRFATSGRKHDLLRLEIHAADYRGRCAPQRTETEIEPALAGR